MIVMVQIPNSGNAVLLLICNMMLLVFVGTNCFLDALENKILKTWYGITLPSLPISTSYGITALFWPLLVFNFAITGGSRLSQIFC